MRYLLGFLITIGLLTLVVILVLKGSSHNQTIITVKPLSSYSTTDAVASLTISGPVVANSNYRQIEIDISQTQSQISIIDGFQGSVVNTQSFTNNQPAFNAFLTALDHFNFTSVTQGYKYPSPTGFCSFGETYDYKLISNEKTVVDSWASSCGGQGNFKGVVLYINQLFTKQIPNYGTMTSTTGL